MIRLALSIAVLFATACVAVDEDDDIKNPPPPDGPPTDTADCHRCDAPTPDAEPPLEQCDDICGEHGWYCVDAGCYCDIASQDIECAPSVECDTWCAPNPTGCVCP
jgi:hypothetical protein